jgi:hypothetical protein
MRVDTVLLESQERDHIVRAYQDDAALAVSVGIYLEKGLRDGLPAIIIATKDHADLLRRRLAGAGLNVEDLERTGRLRVLDARETLTSFMRDGMPDPALYRQTVGGLIDETLRINGAKILRAYGEMVDVLWQEGNHAAAIRLEELWNGLAREYPFSLLCAYRIDDSDPSAYAGALQKICAVHSHYIPDGDLRRREQAVTSAGRELLGDSFLELLRHFAKTRLALDTRMPEAQAALFWFKENMPGTAERIFQRLRDLSRNPQTS